MPLQHTCLALGQGGGQGMLLPFFLNGRPVSGIVLASIAQISLLLLFPLDPLKQCRTNALYEFSYNRIASSLLTLRLPNILVSTLDAPLLVRTPTI